MIVLLSLLLSTVPTVQDPPPPPPLSDVVITAAIQEPGTFLGVPVDFCQATVAHADHDPGNLRLKIWITNGGPSILMVDKIIPAGAGVTQISWIAGDEGVGTLERASHYTVITALFPPIGPTIAADVRDTEVNP